MKSTSTTELLSAHVAQSSKHLGAMCKRKNKEKILIMSSSEETVQAIVHGGSPGERSETTGVGFVKEVVFKPGVKERELWMYE